MEKDKKKKKKKGPKGGIDLEKVVVMLELMVHSIGGCFVAVDTAFKALEKIGCNTQLHLLCLCVHVSLFLFYFHSCK